LLIEYSSLTDKYLCRDGSGTEMQFDDVSYIRNIIEKNKSDYMIQNYDFSSYLSCLCALLNGEAAYCFNGVKNVFR
jgi:hypothetical protein